ncbi:MAG: hypothetical protein AB7T49_13245 [Oligoflexales bacterium]
MRRTVLLLLALLLSGCYEGWEYKGKNGRTPDGPDGPEPEPVDKKYAYILFEPFVMASDAIADTSCFPDQSIALFRSTEWELRISSITSALEQLAETVVVSQQNVTAADCNTVAIARSRSLEVEPWGSQTAPTQDPLDRPFLHLKAAFWEGDPAQNPDFIVDADNHWTAWMDLTAQGWQTLSLNYFVITDRNNGFFSLWETEVPSDLRQTGTEIEPVNPTQEGIDERNQTIADDTGELSIWLQQQ